MSSDSFFQFKVRAKPALAYTSESQGDNSLCLWFEGIGLSRERLDVYDRLRTDVGLVGSKVEIARIMAIASSELSGDVVCTVGV